MMTDPTTIPQCGARTGYAAGEWVEVATWCQTTVGLTSYLDDHGVTRWYCRHHRTFVEHRYPVAKAPEACAFCGDTSAIVDGRYVLVQFEAGLRVVCDDCYSKADEPEWSNREGDPAFNGAFAS